MIRRRAGGCSVEAMRIWLLGMFVVAVLALPSLAYADQRETQAAMQEYFDGEKRGGYVLIGMGVAGLVAGGLLYRHGSPTARGASYPLLGVGFLHLAAGIYINIASNRRIDTFTHQIEDDHAGFVAAERTRMDGVARSFTGLKVAEVVLLVGGLATAGYAWRTDRPRLTGAGLALALEATMTLGFDVVAARRADRYRDALARTSLSASIDPASGATEASLRYAGTF
jgi:hypothetical protein